MQLKLLKKAKKVVNSNAIYNDDPEAINKLKEKVDNSPTAQGPSDGGSSLTGDDLRFLKELNKKTTDLEKNLRTLSSSINLEDIKDDIKKLKEEMQLKGSQQDFFDLNDKVNDYQQIRNIKRNPKSKLFILCVLMKL